MSNSKKNLEDRAWEDMSVLLDKELPQRRIGFLYWFIMAGIMVVLTAGALMYLKPDLISSEQEEKEEVAENEVAIEENVTTISHKELETAEVNEGLPAKEDKDLASLNKSRKTSTIDREELTNLTNSVSSTDREELSIQAAELKKQNGGFRPIINEEISETTKSLSSLSISSERKNPLRKLSLPIFNTLDISEQLSFNEIPIQSPIEVHHATSSLWPDYVQLQLANDLTQNVALDFSTGWEYNLSRKLSLQTGMAYTFDYVAAQPRKVTFEGGIPVFNEADYSSNEEFQDEFTNFLNSSYSLGGNAGWIPFRSASENAYLRYGNLSQHLISLEQNLLYTISNIGERSALYTKIGGRLSYALTTQSSPDFSLAYPQVSNGTISFDNSGNLYIEDPNTYVSQWYYGLHAGVGVHLDQNWSVELNASTIQSMNVKQDFLNLDKKRDIRVSFSLRRHL